MSPLFQHVFSDQGMLTVEKPNAGKSQHAVKYPFVGDRKVLRDMIHELQRSVRPASEVSTMTDKRETTQEVYSVKNAFTMAVGFGFKCGPAPLFKVSGVTLSADHLQVTIRAYFGLSKKHGKKCPAVEERWRELGKNHVIAIAEVGDFALQENSQYLWSADMPPSSREEVLTRMLEVWASIERFAKKHGLLQSVT